ncbi:MAG TPA: SusC/RagA family TonB-linked outer membrane protein [Puia sp.]|nr:SusC/RagA family TonB-linked outer membrane protein [Puia sp.]
MRKCLSLTVFLLAAALAFGQVKTITGKVVDQQGQPVPFATVKIKGSKSGSSADADGNFSIKAKDGDVLVITGTGFNASEATVAGSGPLSIKVTRKENSLSEVVVTALGVQRQAKELGYSTAKINTEELTQAKVTNIGTGLAAKVSGLQVNLDNNGVKPDVRITLRGNRSILGNNQALLVVDDIQLPISYLAELNPDDVANVSVLKGASASALYGSAASNGVIIVTTKKGTRGRAQIRINSSIQVESIAYTPDFQNQFGQNGGEPGSFPGLVHIGDNPYIWYVPYENQNYGPRFNGQRVPLGPPIRIYAPDGSFIIKQDSTNYSADPNAKKGFFDNGIQTQNEVSYSTGDDKSRFYVSFQDVNHGGIIPKDVSRRDAVRVNGSRTTGMLQIDYNLGYTITHTNTTAASGVPFTWGTTPYVGGYAGGGSYFQNRPLYWEIINQPADVNLRNYKNWQTDPFASPDGYFNAYYGNPWWQIDQSRLDEKSNDLLGTLQLTLRATSWLDVLERGGVARDEYSNKYTSAGYNFAPWAIADTLQSGNIPSGVISYSPSEGDGMSINTRLSNDFFANFHRDFGRINAKLIAGTSLIDNQIRFMNLSANALVIPNFYNIGNKLGNPTVNEYEEHTRVFGVFGDLSLGFNNYLFLHGSLRNDWNSLLSSSNRSYLYPAVDLAFVFTDAINSLQNNKVLSFGKLRLAHSRTAQVSIGAYALQNTFVPGGGFPFGGTPGFTQFPAVANPDIKPELSTDDEIGLDLGFLNNRINFSAAVYNTSTKNQTIPIAISSTTGFTSAYVNSGVMKNQGIELDLKFTPVLSTASGFRWDIGANFAYNKNTVESLGYGLTDITLPNPLATQNAVSFSSDAIVGKPYAQAKTSDWLRDPQGHIVVDARTGLPTADANLHAFGTTVPPTKIGLTTTISYKGFTLNAVADGRFGAVIFNGIGPSLDFTGVSAYSASSGRQPFIIPNSVIDEGNGKYVPNTNVNTGNPNQGAQAFWAGVWNSVGSNYVNSADFWKLRELALSYNIPKKALDHLKVVSAINIGIQARNLITWRAKDNIWSDPEFSNTNGNASGNTDINQLPPTKFIGGNISITF